MPVVTLRKILKNAGREKYAVGMFDVHHSDMAEAVLEAAEERNAPVILALAEVHAVQPGQLTAVGSMLVQAAERAGVPVAVHLDHAVSFHLRKIWKTLRRRCVWRRRSALPSRRSWVM